MSQKAKQRAASTGSGRATNVSLVEIVKPSPRPLGREPPVGSQRFIVDEADFGQRLDRFLAERLSSYTGLSRTRLQALITDGHVHIGDRPERRPSARLTDPDPVTVAIPEPAPAEPAAQAMRLEIVFEDADLLVLDKPAGLVVHPAAGHEDGTLVNALIAHCGASLSGIGGVRRPGIVHRLDKDTTGLLVVAKTDAAHRGLADLFADHGRSGSLERAYLGFAWGVPVARQGVIDRPLGRHPHDRKKMAVVPEARGRRALTHWTVDQVYGGFASRIRCRLETGRTHQIRVHLADAGHPLIGDATYGAGFRTKAARLPATAQAVVMSLGRQALHAATLGFDHPITGEPLRFESALPADLNRLADALRKATVDD